METNTGPLPSLGAAPWSARPTGDRTRAGIARLEGQVLAVGRRRRAVGPAVQEDDLLGVDLGALAALAVIALPGVLDQASRHVDAGPFPEVPVDRFGLRAPDDDPVPVGRGLAVLAAAVRESRTSVSPMSQAATSITP